ncbi:Conserved_hypothetical protein [Hexamita inflata]|uniref:MORN repeat-containing protein 3 n=1 Tax=Hexamita inflata TaxID=28002 RepID=A0AA86UUT6_9EUKA|nr:Conserved hypothetical protein [Hexamita inflata]
MSEYVQISYKFLKNSIHIILSNNQNVYNSFYCHNICVNPTLIINLSRMFEDLNRSVQFLSKQYQFDYYTGQMFNNKYHGHGTLQTKKGLYQGGFNNGEYCGRGVLRFLKDGYYSGKWLKGERSDYGIQCQSGNFYKGQFREDLMHGFGELYVNTNTQRQYYKGFFKEGNFDGVGLLEYIENEIVIKYYNGDFKNGVYDGSGTLIFDGNKYMGKFQNGEFHGSGTMTVYGVVTTGNWDCGKLIL